jgi:hypothetical protein
MLISAVVVISSCKSKNKGGEETILPTDLVNNPGSGGAENSRMAEITFVKEEHDFGIIKDGEKVFWNFRFTNTGNAPLILNRVKADCGCTVPDYPKTPIAPGEEGKIKVTFDSKGRPGRQIKKVTVLSNSERPTNVLTITAIVEK